MTKTAERKAKAVQTERTWLDDVGPQDERRAILNLLYAARGVSLILESFDERDEIENSGIIASGLASALQFAADDVDAVYFKCAGHLATTLNPSVLSALLKKELTRTESEIVKQREVSQAKFKHLRAEGATATPRPRPTRAPRAPGSGDSRR